MRTSLQIKVISLLLAMIGFVLWGTGGARAQGTILFSTDPINNSTGVSVEPVLKFNFNYPVKFNENISSDAITQFITITANGIKSNLDSIQNLNLSEDGKVLTINLHNHQNSQDIPLLKNTYYQVEIEPDLLQIVNDNIYNPKIQLSFTTTGEGANPMAVSYSSDRNGSDDVRFLEHRNAGDKITNLDAGGSIYIKFANKIEADYCHSYTSLLDAARIYKMPRTEQQTNEGKTEQVESYYLYHNSVDESQEDRIVPGNIPYVSINNNFAILEDQAYLEEIPVGTVEIIDSQTLKITSKNKLQSLNKYKLIINRQVIQDEHGYNLSDDVDVNFWTRAGSANKSGTWQPPSISTTQSGAVTKLSPNVYSMSGTPVYGPVLPIVLNVNGEVIPRIRDEVLSSSGSQESCRINYDSLKQISLTDTYNPDSASRQVTTSRFELYHSQDSNSTRILLYPLTGLGYGKEYRLIVPAGVLETRDGNSMEKLELNLLVAANPLNPENVYQLDNNTAKVTEIWKQSYWNLKIIGGNLRGDITDVRLTPVSGRAQGLAADEVPIIISKGDLELNSSTELTVKIRGDNAAKFAREQYTGQYSITINFDNGTTTVLGAGSGLEIEQQLVLNGQNFRSDIKQVTLQQVGGSTQIILYHDDVQYVDSQEIILKIRGENAQTLASIDNTGEYKATIDYETTTTINTGLTQWSLYVPNKLYFTVLPKGRPRVLSYYPDSSDSSECYDENTMLHDIQDAVTANRQFLKITFEDIDGKLELNSRDDLQKTSVAAVGDETSLVDTNFIGQAAIDPYLLRKDRVKGVAYLYIPIAKMKSQTSYRVTIPAGVVKNDSSEEFNDPLSWSIITTAIPVIYDRKISVQSVGENYDPLEPIMLKGEQFSGTGLKVYFNDVAAAKVEVHSNGEEQYLSVYLPKKRLTPGLYNITVANNVNHQTTAYGVFSVVAAGENVPGEGQRVKDSSVGEVVATVCTSEDTLELKAKYSNRNKVELDLDKLMSKDVLVRKIKFDADRHDSIDKLITLSCWADIILYNVSCEDDKDEQEVEIRLGRIPASLSQSLKAKLNSRGIKSDFIEADGNNLKVDGVDLKIPYRQSDGNNLKVLRYEERLRSWYEVPFVTDYVNQSVAVNNTQPGIFVVVSQ
ncbi:MAG: Ig-like domain-containing protein [Syntrophomonas sp.]